MKKYDFCTMVGNPAYYSEKFRDFGDESLTKLKEMEVNTVLVNIAWSRPYIDAVILEHVVQSKEFPKMSDADTVNLRMPQLKERIKNIHKNGMKAMALFGMPIYIDYKNLPEEYKVMLGSTFSTVSVDQVTCILSEATRRYYKELLTKALAELDLDSMLIYTYDELAEVCDEDSDCPRCKGIPLEDRLPGFLNEINSHIQTLKPGFEMWWEPWELSASQVYLCLESLDKSIGISCHSTLHEVYHVNHPDIFVRNVGMLAKRQGRKFMVEMFLSGSGEDLGPIAGFPCPRLVFEQIKELELLEGVTGIKEYFGTAVPYMSVNEEMTGAALRSDLNFDEVILKIASRFSNDKAQQKNLIEAWNLTAQALLLAPWDMSWVLRFSNLQPYDRAYWGEINFWDTMKTPWFTPAWLSNRRSYYLVTDHLMNNTTHMKRDFDKRMKMSIDSAINAEIILKDYSNNSEIQTQIVAVKMYITIMSARRNYMNICNLLAEHKTGEFKLFDGNKFAQTLRGILTEDLINAKSFAELLKKQELEHYFPIKNTLDGIEYLEKILSDDGELIKYFSFYKYL